MLNTPVLFITFNRPETTAQVFEAIRKAKPKQLFVAADGPRAGNRDDNASCEEVRRLATKVDWDCELETLFRNDNIGCGRGPVEAINWFFDHVEQGIILEDDCLPSQSFFKFCEELLEKYSTEDRVHSISGSNLLGDWSRNKDSYFFSIHAGIWGWATWRRSWLKYDFNAAKWQNKNIRELFNFVFTNENQRNVYIKALNETIEKKGNICWWDYQFIFSRIVTSSFGIIPKTNLVRNIGFGDGATHTFDSTSLLASLPMNEIEFPLKNPEGLMIDQEYDFLYSLKFYPRPNKVSFQSLKERIKSPVKKLFKK